jgi:hypothetical protein
MPRPYFLLFCDSEGYVGIGLKPGVKAVLFNGLSATGRWRATV